MNEEFLPPLLSLQTRGGVRQAAAAPPAESPRRFAAAGGVLALGVTAPLRCIRQADKLSTTDRDELDLAIEVLQRRHFANDGTGGLR
jgi:hypothetical protein